MKQKFEYRVKYLLKISIKFISRQISTIKFSESVRILFSSIERFPSIIIRISISQGKHHALVHLAKTHRDLYVHDEHSTRLHL